MTKRGIKASLTEASLAWRCFGLYNKKHDSYTFKIENVRGFIRKPFEGGSVCAFNRYFEPKHFDKNMLTSKNYLKRDHNENSSVIDKHIVYIVIKENEYQAVFIVDETDYRKKGKNGRVHQ